MQAISKTTDGVGGLGLTEHDVPEPGPGEFRLKVAAAGICGTDMQIYNWAPRMARRMALPRILGHEASDVVDTVGPGVTRVVPGDHVSLEASGVAGQSVLVSGCGPIGLMAVAAARALGTETIIAADPNGLRRDQGRRAARIMRSTPPRSMSCRPSPTSRVLLASMWRSSFPATRTASAPASHPLPRAAIFASSARRPIRWKSI